MEVPSQNIMTGAYRLPPGVPPSPECKDLIQRILRPKPQERLTIAAIRQHPWFLHGPPVRRLSTRGICIPQLGNYGLPNCQTCSPIPSNSFQCKLLIANLCKSHTMQEAERPPRLQRIPSQDEDDVRSVLSRAVEIRQQPLDFQPLS